MRKEELYSIAKGFALTFGVDKKVENFEEFLNDFISFHIEWTRNKEIANFVTNHVIRDILAVLHIIADGENEIKTIMNIYGSRYTKEVKDKNESNII